MSTIDFLKTLSHPVLKALTRKLNLHTSIKGFTTLSRDDLINKLAEKTTYNNGKLTVTIPVVELTTEKEKKPRKPRSKKTETQEATEKKQRKPRSKKNEKPEVTEIETVTEAPVQQLNEDLTAKLASFINTLSIETTHTENEKVKDKKDMITEAIAEVENIEKNVQMTKEDKKNEILNVLVELQENKPDIDLSILSQDKKEVNENLDDGLKEFTKQLFQSFYEDELAELDSLSFNFGSSDIEPEAHQPGQGVENTKKIITAEVDEESGMILVMEEEEPELIQASKMIERERTQRENIMKPIIEDRPIFKNFVDELNDQLAELDELSFNYGQTQIEPIAPIKMASPVKMEQPMQSPPMMQEKPKEKKQIPMQRQNEEIEDQGQWVKDNLTPLRKFKTPNERYSWLYYPPEEINAIDDKSILMYLKDETNTFRGLSPNHSLKTLQYITAQLNSIDSRLKQLSTNVRRGRPFKEETSEYKEEQRQKRITDLFDNLPEEDKIEFYSTVKKIDSDVTSFMREYALYESFEDSYKPFSEDWQYDKKREFIVDGQKIQSNAYDIIFDKYRENDEIMNIIENNDINDSNLASWIELHIQRKNMLAEFNKIIKRAEKVRNRDPKLLNREASKIQAGIRGFLTRKRLEREPMAKSDVVKEKQSSAVEKYKSVIATGLPSIEVLKNYLETPKASVKEILIDINKYFESNNISKKGQDSILKRLNKSLKDIRAEKEKEFYDIEFNRKEFNAWKELLLKQSYASSGQQAKMYDLKKQYKKTADETKQTEILEKFAQVYNQQKVNKLLTNYNIE